MDSSSLCISPQSPMVTYMDLRLFRASENGNMEPFKAYQDRLDQLLDANQNTVLHIYSMTGGDKDSLEISTNNFLQQLIDECPQMLLQGNARGEIPLHVAVRHGHRAIVEFFLNLSKEQHVDLEQMLRMRDKEQNTALHKAAQYCHLDVVRVLLNEDPEYLSSAVNTSGETPLYLAARGGSRGYDLLVAEILDASNCEPMALVGPRSRTILHAAAMANNEETVKIILERKNHLAKERDEDGWTPLHCAAQFGHYSVAELLLKCDGSAAYITDEKRGMSPLHMAAWRGNTEMMELIISNCPGCIGILDKRGWNFLHFALLTLPPKHFYHHFFDDHDRIFLRVSETRNLLDEKGENGITPFHILLYGPARLRDGYDDVVSALIKSVGFGAQIPDWVDYWQDSQDKKEIEQVLEELGNIEVAGKPVHDSFFRENMKDQASDSNSIHHSFRENMECKDRKTKINNERLEEKARETHLLVATLVATVTFAAALTVPGGYKSDEGGAILSRNSAFKAFVISDSLSFILSLSAVFIHFFTVLLKRIPPKFSITAHLSTLFAMLTMVIAFSTGLYAVLESSAIALAIAACSITIISFCVVYMFTGLVLSDYI